MLLMLLEDMPRWRYYAARTPLLSGRYTASFALSHTREIHAMMLLLAISDAADDYDTPYALVLQARAHVITYRLRDYYDYLMPLIAASCHAMLMLFLPRRRCHISRLLRYAMLAFSSSRYAMLLMLLMMFTPANTIRRHVA